MLLSIGKICNKIHIQIALEFSGLWKYFGHTDIDMDSSVATWIEKGEAGKGEVVVSEMLLCRLGTDWGSGG